MKPGHCYEETFNAMLNDDILAKEGVIVHGKVQDPETKKWIDHAWIEIGVMVVDPSINDGFIKKSQYYEIFNAQPENKYTELESIRQAFKMKKGFCKW